MLSFKKLESVESVQLSPEILKKIEAALVSTSELNKKDLKTKNQSILLTGGDNKSRIATAYMLSRKAGKDLYRINLSEVVNKYIGETEKNLATVFKSAEGKDWILFFDEADALFGKRTEVKDAHDRFANIEVSYLLQRIEEYNGIVILSSNFKQSVDSAFLRRIRYVIEL